MIMIISLVILSKPMTLHTTHMLMMLKFTFLKKTSSLNSIDVHLLFHIYTWIAHEHLKMSISRMESLMFSTNVFLLSLSDLINWHNSNQSYLNLAFFLHPISNVQGNPTGSTFNINLKPSLLSPHPLSRILVQATNISYADYCISFLIVSLSRSPLVKPLTSESDVFLFCSNYPVVSHLTHCKCHIPYSGLQDLMCLHPSALFSAHFTMATGVSLLFSRALHF